MMQVLLLVMAAMDLVQWKLTGNAHLGMQQQQVYVMKFEEILKLLFRLLGTEMTEIQLLEMDEMLHVQLRQTGHVHWEMLLLPVYALISEEMVKL